MKLKTNELTGAALDWAVAKCEGQVSDSARFMAIFTHQNKTKQSYCSSTDWAQGGPIIEREMIQLSRKSGWLSFMHPVPGVLVSSSGPTPLVAAMRCYVASKLGDEVEVPESILDEMLRGLMFDKAEE